MGSLELTHNSELYHHFGSKPDSESFGVIQNLSQGRPESKSPGVEISVDRVWSRPVSESSGDVVAQGWALSKLESFDVRVVRSRSYPINIDSG